MRPEPRVGGAITVLVKFLTVAPTVDLNRAIAEILQVGIDPINVGQQFIFGDVVVADVEMLPDDVVFVGAPIKRRLGVGLRYRLRSGYDGQTSYQQAFPIDPHKSIQSRSASVELGSDRRQHFCMPTIGQMFSASHGFICLLSPALMTVDK